MGSISWEGDMTPFDRDISRHLVGLVQIVFGVVLAGSLSTFEDAIVSPLSHVVAVLALVTVYATVVLSWIDWHTTMELNPYRVSKRDPRRRLEYGRLFTDLLIVVVYSYLLFTAKPSIDDPSAELSSHVWGYAAVFVLYLLGGVIRRAIHGRIASDLTAISGGLVAFVVLSCSYSRLFGVWPVSPALFNGLTLAVVFLVMVLYRLMRARRREARRQRRQAGLSIGVDVDGVLANQIAGVLPRIAQRYGLQVTYDDISDWRYKIGNSDIAEIIEAAMGDQDYILEMPVHPGAKELVDALGDAHRLVPLTARPDGTRDLTEEWLLVNRLNMEKVVSAKEAAKGAFGTDWLLDDYQGNIVDFLETSSGRAILIDQPWNRNNRETLQTYLDSQRLFVARDLLEARDILLRELQPSAGRDRRRDRRVAHI